MSLRTRYSGRFISQRGWTWQADILVESDVPFDNVGDLTFEGEEPIVVEWGETDKHEPLIGSTATLRIESPGDRTYTELYTIEPGRVQLRIYRVYANGSQDLFWAGALDPEFYEEPYESAANYTVVLTFSDFGILDRIKWSGDGMVRCSDIFSEAFSLAGLPRPHLQQNIADNLGHPHPCTSTTYADGQRANPYTMMVNAANFYDEDGEPRTYKEVMEAILQPLALRMVQRWGYVLIYDINAMHSLAVDGVATEEITWDGPTQTLGTDKVYNSVKVTFSPYAGTTVYESEVEMPVKPPTLDINYSEGVDCLQYIGTVATLSGHVGNQAQGNLIDWLTADDPDEFLRRTEGGLQNWSDPNGKPKTNWDGAHGGYCIFPNDWEAATRQEEEEQRYVTKLMDFAIFHSFLKSPSVAQQCRRNPCVQIVPLGGGSSQECTAIAGHYVTPGWGPQGLTELSGYPRPEDYASELAARRHWRIGRSESLSRYDFSVPAPEPVYTTKRVYLPPCGNASKQWLRIQLPILCDPRYNPFTEAGDANDKNIYDAIKKRSRWFFVPVGVLLYDTPDADRPVSHYRNYDYGVYASVGHLNIARGYWADGDGYPNRSMFAYYNNGDDSNAKGESGILGWQTNRHNIGRPDHTKNYHDKFHAAWVLDKYGDSMQLDPNDPQPRFQSREVRGFMCEPFKKMGDGEYIPYPPDGGWLEIKVWPGIWPFEACDRNWFNAPSSWCMWGQNPNINCDPWIRWMLYKLPTVEIARDSSDYSTEEAEDQEFGGWVNKHAKEELSIDTECGTLDSPTPAARGQLYTAETTPKPIRELTRGGITDRPERLLIGTIISNHAQRMTTLSGEALMASRIVSAYTERNQPGKYFISKTEIADLMTGTSDLTVVEIAPDEYVPIEDITHNNG